VFRYLCSLLSNMLFIALQEGSKLQLFMYIVLYFIDKLYAWILTGFQKLFCLDFLKVQSGKITVWRSNLEQDWSSCYSTRLCNLWNSFGIIHLGRPQFFCDFWYGLPLVCNHLQSSSTCSILYKYDVLTHEIHQLIQNIHA
jgi:hypothetical protein